MTPDPRYGHLFDAASASGFGLDRLRVRPGHPPLGVARTAWEAAYARWVDRRRPGRRAARRRGAACCSSDASSTPVLAGATGVLVTVTTLLMLYLAGAWDPTVLGNGGAEYRRLVRGFAAAGAALALAGLATRITDVRAVGVRGHPRGVRARDPRPRGAAPTAAPPPPRGRVQARGARGRLARRGGRPHHPHPAGPPPRLVGHGRVHVDRYRPHPGRAGGRRPRRRRRRGPARPAPHRVGGPGPGWTSARLHQLAWDIEEIGAEMVVDPGLVEVAGPRLRTAPVDGLPLLAVSRPTLGGAGWLAKAVADRVCAAVLLLALAPLLLGLAFAIRSGGRPCAAQGDPHRARRRAVHAPAVPLDGGGSRAARDRRRRLDAPLRPRRAAAAVQRARRVDVAGRAAAAAPGRGRGRGPPGVPGQAGAHRAVAGRRRRRAVVGGERPARPALRAALVADPGRGDPRPGGGRYPAERAEV